MPRTEVVFYQDDTGHAPVIEWLRELRRMDETAYAKCIAVIERLQESGHELRRPTADILRDGIHELRAKKGRVQYRILYFFNGRDFAILAHAITKESAIPDVDIQRALRRKAAFQSDPAKHTYSEPTP